MRLDELQRLQAALGDRYAIERALGSGGTATVYLAQDPKHHRQVAIKVLHPDLAAAIGPERFLREIEIAANLSHPHILPLYDSGEAQGFLYYVMPYVVGESLRDRLTREKQLPLDDAMRIVREVADALSYAHIHGVVHRDVKPENILLSGHHAVVADFGVARAISISGTTTLTTMGLAVGTPAYMSPEQASGERELDGRSDIYALGCVLYELLAGRPPFVGPTLESLTHQHIMATPPPIASIRPSVTPALAKAIERALAKTAADRYQTAAQFAEALAHAVATMSSASAVALGEPAPAEHAAVPRTLLRDLWARRVPQFLAAYAALSAVVVALLGFLVNRFVLSPHLPDFGIVALASLTPTIALVSYFHGRPGARGWRPVEKIGIPANVLASAGLLVLMFATKDLGAATTRVTVHTEDGQRVERVVVKSEFRKRVALFYFENQSGDSTLNWVRYGVPLGLGLDLDQDLFLDVRAMPFQFAEQLRKTGFPEGLNVPLALKRQLADEAHLPYFVSGAVQHGRQLSLQMSLYETRRGKLLARHVLDGPDVLGLIDQLSVQLKHDLEIPAQHVEEVEDLPVAEVTTASLDAFRASAEGLHAALISRDWRAASRHLERSVLSDSAYAIAHVLLSQVYLALNDGARAQIELEAAMRHRYQLPERRQFDLKSMYYDLRRDPAKVLAVLEMRVELFPDDLEGRQILASVYWLRNRRGDAIAQYQRILKLDPSHQDALKTVAEMLQQLGRYEDALANYRRYTERFPQDHQAYVAIGQLYEMLGRHGQARAQYERALLLKPDEAQIRIRLADLAFDAGDFDGEAVQLGETLRAAKTAADSAAVYAALASHYELQGQLMKAIDYTQLQWAVMQRFAPPLILLQQRLSTLDRYVQAGQDSIAFATLEAVGRELNPPFDMLLPLGALTIHLEREEPDQAEVALPEVEALIQAFGAEILRPFVLHARGRIQELRGKYDQAVAIYREELALEPTDVKAPTAIGRCFRSLKRYGEAEQYIRKTLTVHPFDPRAHYEMALVFTDRGDRTRAAEHLRKALAVWRDADPKFKAAQRARAKLAELTPAS